MAKKKKKPTPSLSVGAAALQAAMPRRSSSDLSNLSAGSRERLARVVRSKGPYRRPRGNPGRDGRIEEGERLIEDPSPYSIGKKVVATVNVRESAIDHMRSRGRIDPTQAAAGDWFRRVWEMAAIGRQKGIDYADAAGRGVGGVSDPMTDQLVQAGQELAHILNRIGPRFSQILIRIVGEGDRIKDVAANWSKAGGIVKGKAAEGYITGTLIDAIDEVVRARKMVGVGERKLIPATYLRAGTPITVNDSIRADQSVDWTGPATELYVHWDGTVTIEEVKPIDRGPLSPQASGNLGSDAPAKGKRSKAPAQ